MSGRHPSPMDPNTPGSAAYRRARLAVTERCARDDISRQTEDPGSDRDLLHGPQGLEERSRGPGAGRPRGAPSRWWRPGVNATPAGPASPPQPGPPEAPAPGHGASGHPPCPLEAPTAVWRADGKGPCKTGDGRAACHHERPPEALARHTPAAGAAPSPRHRPHTRPPRASPDRVAVRDGNATGGRRWHRPGGHVSSTCAGEDVGLTDSAAGVWNVAVGPRTRGRRLKRHRRREEAYGRLTRHR
jgi:hypothetical protein